MKLAELIARGGEDPEAAFAAWLVSGGCRGFFLWFLDGWEGYGLSGPLAAGRLPPFLEGRGMAKISDILRSELTRGRVVRFLEMPSLLVGVDGPRREFAVLAVFGAGVRSQAELHLGCQWFAMSWMERSWRGGCRAGLTDREKEALRWAAAGKTAGEAGGIMGISGATADGHMKAACRKMGVSGRAGAVGRALRLGLIE